MRIVIKGKAEKQLITLMNETGVDNPTHLVNLLLNYLTTTHLQEATNYARQHDTKAKA